jgi:hypothetical protein
MDRLLILQIAEGRVLAPKMRAHTLIALEIEADGNGDPMYGVIGAVFAVWKPECMIYVDGAQSWPLRFIKTTNSGTIMVVPERACFESLCRAYGGLTGANL